MKIRPKNISKFQIGGTTPQWYLDRYGNRTSLLGWTPNLRYNYSNKNLNTNDHRNAGTLDTVYRKNVAYTQTPGAISSDILNYYNSDGNGMSAEDFVNFYNSNAAKIRSHWAQNLTYNARTAGEHNQLFRKMFASRSDLSQSPGSDYNIGYLNNLEDVEGSSTWLRRMDQYEKEFDLNNPDNNRLHELILKDGTKALVYKKANGDIGLYKTNNQNNLDLSDLNTEKSGGVRVAPKADPESPLEGFSTKLKKAIPGIIDLTRLVGNLANNNKVFEETLKGIRPNLQLSYHTHRQVVGDEATKLAYYRRAVQGEQKAARPMTSDADRLVAYMMEAKRVGDELRAQGDLADNQEIRRTSDESNQHQWANVQRDTEVANRNTIELNNANAAILNLKALKASADWTNIDNYLMGIQNKLELKRARIQLFEDLANLSAILDGLYDDEEYKNAYLEYLKVAKENTVNGVILENQAVTEAARKVRKAKNNYLNRAYRSLYLKSGSKIEYKTTDNYLYKTSRDVVEHFRKMSKMADDSRLRSRTKPIKLSLHPKKMQQGGVAPFTIYRPLGVGELGTTYQSSDSGTGKKGDPAKDKLDMIKELFKEIRGLPIDVSSVYQEIQGHLLLAKLLGEDLTSDDIASMYLSSMLKLSNIKYSKEIYDKAMESATNKDALEEFAVTTNGKLVLQNTDTGEIKLGSYEEFIKSKENLNPLTNNQLLYMRAYSPNMLLSKGDEMMQIVNNGIGVSKIAEFLKAQLPALGATENTIEGYTKHEVNQIKAGLELLKEAPAGDYKFTQYTKDLQQLANKALLYLQTILPRNMKAVLLVHAGLQGTTVNNVITNLISSKMDLVSKLEFDAVTGKAANKEEKDSIEKIKSNPLMQLILGEGGVPRTWNLITKDSNVKMSIDGIEYSQLPKITEDMSLDKMLSESGIAGILDSKLGITFGDLSISPDLLKDVMYSNSGGMVVTLPCKIVNGHKEVNLGVKKTYEEAIQEVESKGISKNSPEYYKMLGEVLKQKGLNSLLDSNGYPDRNKFGQFLVVEAYTTDKIKNLDTSSQYIEKVKNPDALLEERMIKALSTDSKKSNYNLDIDYWLYGDDVYRGTVFIPLSNNLNAAINVSGDLISVENARELENKFQNFNKASNMKSSNSDVL